MCNSFGKELILVSLKKKERNWKHELNVEMSEQLCNIMKDRLYMFSFFWVRVLALILLYSIHLGIILKLFGNGIHKCKREMTLFRPLVTKR